MQIFVVRLNPDTREGITPYSEYVTSREYEEIHHSSPMNGFHEAVNFLAEEGVVRGYIPPGHLRAMRSETPFILLTITAKKVKVGGDRLVGIQAGCLYQGTQDRPHPTNNSKFCNLTWHYVCPASLSLLLPTPIPDARALVLEDGRNWGQGPTYEISTKTLSVVLNRVASVIKDEEKQRFDLIKEFCSGVASTTYELDISVKQEFSLQVRKVLNDKEGNLDNIVGNKQPMQKRVYSFQYQRDPKVVAYALRKANGICGDCGGAAPFISKTTGEAYLEVHHIKTLAEGGADTTDNVIALCPNCHRKRHYG